MADMKNTLQLTSSRWSYESYIRKAFQLDIIYTVLQYKEMNALYNLNLGKLHLQDRFVEQMLFDHLITSEMMNHYEECVIGAFHPLSRFDDVCIEDIYGVLYQERKKCFGIDLIEKEQYLMAQKEIAFQQEGGIDQTKKKEALLTCCDSVIFVLTDAALFFLMKKDMEEALKQGKTLYIVTGLERGDTVPSKEWMETVCPSNEKIHYLTMECRNHGLNFEGVSLDEELQNQIDKNETFLIVYGEDGFLSCKELLIDSIVYGIPSGYFTRTLTNQHAIDRACVAYIPKEFDITRWVSIWGRTRISYWQLAKLWEDFGDEVYAYTPEELYLKYPQYFLNVYADDVKYKEAEPEYPIQLVWENVKEKVSIMKQFDQIRDEAIKDYLNKNENVQYVSTYFNEEMEQMDIPWYADKQQNGILVQAFRIGKVKDSYVIKGDGKTVRNIMRDDPREENTVRLLSNFLFFLTPRLAQLYNELRKEEKRQQIDFSGGHLDYMFYYEDGKRIETFPLFAKSCIGMTTEGKYLFFRCQLGGGSVTINGETIRWEKDEVNTEVPKQVSVFTPLYVKEQEGIEPKKYKVQVGENRVNIVMIQNHIICIRKGPVLLSGIGVVLSMEEKMGMQFLEKIGAKPLEDGYFDCENFDSCVVLDQPEGVEDWDKLKWAYGGGLSLLMDGKTPCDEGEEALVRWLSKEGWMSILSKQTQESAIEKLTKHPRTGIGITKDGSLVILVYSGRTTLSVGADYREMVCIARKIFPDIWNMMNVDGGGSAFLGMTVGNSFMELSFPATSADNCAGMVRPVNTILCLEL